MTKTKTVKTAAATTKQTAVTVWTAPKRMKVASLGAVVRRPGAAQTVTNVEDLNGETIVTYGDTEQARFKLGAVSLQPSVRNGDFIGWIVKGDSSKVEPLRLRGGMREIAVEHVGVIAPEADATDGLLRRAAFVKAGPVVVPAPAFKAAPKAAVLAKRTSAKRRMDRYAAMGNEALFAIAKAELDAADAALAGGVTAGEVSLEAAVAALQPAPKAGDLIAHVAPAATAEQKAQVAQLLTDVLSGRKRRAKAAPAVTPAAPKATAPKAVAPVAKAAPVKPAVKPAKDGALAPCTRCGRQNTNGRNCGSAAACNKRAAAAKAATQLDPAIAPYAAAFKPRKA